MQFEAAFKTDIGRKRKQNQDNGVSLPDLGLFVVADGMGGHQGGETASAMVVEIIPEFIRKKAKKSTLDPKALIAEAIRAANNEVHRKAATQNNLQGMGTTTTAMFFYKNILIIGHVGDSRCYFFRPDAVWQLTRDHSLVAEKLRAGLISPEEAKTDTMKNVITRSVGFEPEVEVDTYEFETHPGDVFLLCSDGLTGFMDDQGMLETLKTKLFQSNDLNGAVQSLIDQANQNGGEDNISVLVVRVK